MTHHHVEHIKAYLKSQGFTDLELMDDLTDHLATEIEFCMDSEKLDFKTSFEKAKQKLLPNSPYQLERDLKILTTPKHNIMMKKIAYMGGYLSATCLCLTILFFSQSLLGSKKSELKIKALEVEYYRNFTELTATMSDELNRKISDHRMAQILESSRKFELAELFMIIALLLFAGLFLPYQFYHRYQKSQLELTA